MRSSTTTRTASQDFGEPQDTSTQDWLAIAEVDDVALDPADATNPINTNHTLTATVTDGGTPVEGVQVVFVMKGGSATFNGYPFDFALTTDETDSAGHAQATWSSAQPGTDNARGVYADTDRDGVKDTGEPSDTATKRWERITFASSVTMTPETGAKDVVGTQTCFSTAARDPTATSPPSARSCSRSRATTRRPPSPSRWT